MAGLARLVRDVILVGVGSALAAVGVVLFLVPSAIAPGGISGLSVIVNHLVGWPIGVMTLIGNIPIQIIAFRMLGGGKVLFLTIWGVVVFSLTIDILEPILSPSALSTDRLLNAIFGGVLGGIGGGLILRGGGTGGGTATLGRVLQYRFGVPLSSAFLYTDTIVFLLAGFVFGWEAAMLAMLSLFISGIATDYVMEGPSVIRTLTIITDHPDEVSAALLGNLHRGVTAWKGVGMYTHQERHILFITVSRAQVNVTRQIVLNTDPKAFVVIGQGHAAYGRGFREAKILPSPQG